MKQTPKTESKLSFAKKILLVIMASVLTISTLVIVSHFIMKRPLADLGPDNYALSLYGKSEEDVLKHFTQLSVQKTANTAVILTLGTQRWKVASQDIALTAQIEDAARKVCLLGRNPDKSIFANAHDRLRMLFETDEELGVALQATYDISKLNKIIDKIALEVHKEPVNAACWIANGNFSHSAAVDGHNIDKKSLLSELDTTFTHLALPSSKELQLKTIPAFIQDNDLADIDALLASYTTSYEQGNRGDNIERAVKSLDGTIIHSGATISFNKLVGIRAHETGYKDAPVVIDDHIEYGPGGGVCQVSSTLYNAALLSGLVEVERHPHYSLSSYCPAGRDATVVNNTLDLKIKNSFAHPVYIRTSTNGLNIVINVYGTKSDLDGSTIELVNQGTTMEPKLYRLWSKNGQLINSEFLHADSYGTLRS